jgi:hypothetical protein
MGEQPEHIMTIHTKHWDADVFLFEDGDETTARVVVQTDVAPVRFKASARRNPGDFAVEGIGDELAVGRALIGLGRTLIGLTEQDIEAVEGHQVRVHE